MTTALTLLCLTIFAQLAPLDDSFRGTEINAATWSVTLGAGASFARLEPRDGGNCLHLFGDHSATTLATRAPVPDIAYTLDYDFFQPAKEVGGYQAVVQHPRPEGSAYWWFEYGPERFYLYTVSGGHWLARWQPGAPADRWLHVRISNTPRAIKISVFDESGKQLMAESPPVPHDDGTPAPLIFSATGDQRGVWGMKIANVHLRVTPIADRDDYRHRRASLDAARAALASDESKRLWPDSDAALVPVQALFDAITATSAGAWDAYVKASAAFDAALKSVATQYRASVLDRLDRRRGDWTTVDLVPHFNAEAALEGIAAPGPGPVVEVSSVPFSVLGFGPNCLWQDLPSRGRHAIPLKAEASSLALLLAPVYDQALYGADDSLIDVLGVELSYADGFRERIFPTPAGWTPPLPAGIGRPPMEFAKAAAYVVEPGHAAPLIEVALCDDAIQAGWALLALSYKSGRPTELPVIKGFQTASGHMDGPATVKRTADTVVLENRNVHLALDSRRGLLRELHDPACGSVVPAERPSPIFAVEVDNRLVYSDEFVVTGVDAAPLPEATGMTLLYRLTGPGAGGPLAVEVSIALNRAESMIWRAKLTNTFRVAGAATKARLIFPLLDGLDFGPRPTWFFPQRGGAASDLPLEALASYGGMAWLQVLDISRAGGGGLYMRCDDPTGIYKIFALRSSPDAAAQPARVAEIPEPAHPLDPWRVKAGVHMSVQYLPRVLAAGASFSPPPVTLAFHGTDWHDALADYSDWLHTWWKQVRPCPDAYRYGFYALVGGPPADKERNEDCGSYDWWHLGPIWSIDYPDDLPELAMLKTEATRAAKWGQAVGLYIEGMCMEKKRRIAREHGEEWAMMTDAGKLYDYYSSEGNPVLNMCPAVPAWQKWDAAAYAEIARRYSLCAMYVDSTGSRWSEVCYNPAHKHLTPGIWVQGCGALFESIRQAVMKTSPQTAIHSEEPGSDFMALHEDGSWSHSLWTSISGDPAFNPAGLNYFRFVLPEFKMYEIPSYRHALWRCKLAFFNGEGLWTNRPDALRRELFTRWMPALRENADTFQSADVFPATTQVEPPLYMNAFTRGSQTIYTVYNAGLRSRRAEIVLHVRPSDHVFDLLRLTEVKCPTGPTPDSLALETHLDPHEVQCYLLTPRLMTADLQGDRLTVSLPSGLVGGKLWAALIDDQGVRRDARFIDLAAGAREATLELTRLFGDVRGRVLLRIAGPHSTADETSVLWR
jgi:hypothetical protein